MKKIICILAVLLISSQLFAEKITEYKAANNITYHVGDTLKLGRGSASNGDFNYLQMGGFYNTMSAANGQYGNIGSGIGRNYSGLDVVIKKIKKGKFKGGEKVIFVIGGGNITNYNLMIEDAIATGEVDDGIDDNTKSENIPQKDKLTKLKELKQLLDDEVLTKEEYDSEKKKILDEK